MISINRIMLASDLSENSLRAKEYARTLTAQFNAELHVLHILEKHLDSTPSFGGGLALNTYVHESATAAEKKIYALFEPAWLLGKNLVTAALDGSPTEKILEYSKDHGIDLIILGTHGRTGLSHVLMGSVAEQIVRQAKCPVLVVPSRS